MHFYCWTFCCLAGISSRASLKGRNGSFYCFPLWTLLLSFKIYNSLSELSQLVFWWASVVWKCCMANKSHVYNYYFIAHYLSASHERSCLGAAMLNFDFFLFLFLHLVASSSHCFVPSVGRAGIYFQNAVPFISLIYDLDVISYECVRVKYSVKNVDNNFMRLYFILVWTHDISYQRSSHIWTTFTAFIHQTICLVTSISFRSFAVENCTKTKFVLQIEKKHFLLLRQALRKLMILIKFCK